MISATELLESLEPYKALKFGWDSYDKADPPNELAFSHIRTILEKMQTDALEGTKVVPHCDGGLEILWSSTFNKGHLAYIDCLNNGHVTLVSANMNSDADLDFRYRVISDLNSAPSDEVEEGTLTITLKEALEFIRHYMWADHK